MKNISIKKIKIGVAMLISFVIVAYGAPLIFIDDTSRLRPDTTANIKTLPQNIAIFARGLLHLQNVHDEEQTNNMRSMTVSATIAPNGPAIKKDYSSSTKQATFQIKKATSLSVYEITLQDGSTKFIYAKP